MPEPGIEPMKKAKKSCRYYIALNDRIDDKDTISPIVGLTVQASSSKVL